MSGVRRARGGGLLLGALAAACGCAHLGAAGGGASTAVAPTADSVTVALWHLDEATGARLFDSGPYRLALSSGVDARPDFGRVNGARRFQRTLDSFMYSPANPVLVPGSGFTCEMWVYPTEFGQYELTPLAACWNETPNQQSWLFGICGQNIAAGRAYLPSPGFFATEVPDNRVGQLVFVFQPEAAGGPRTFFSAAQVALNRWTHVAVTFDDDVVRFWIDGLMDSQYASAGNIRPSPAPLMIGNYFDPTGLTGFSGTLRANVADPNPYYAYVGSLDEIRISSAARSDFPKRQ